MITQAEFSEVEDRALVVIPLPMLLVLLLGLNLFDAFATVLWVTWDLATEANPMMAGLLQSSPPLFVLVKMSLVGLGCLLLWRLRANPGVHFVVECLALVYAGLGVYHLQGFVLLFS